MSNIFKNASASSLPPTVPTSFETDINSPAVPVGNQLDVFGGSSTINNNNGIQTDGSSGGDTLTVQLTNRFQNSVTTNNATPTAISTFALGAIPGVYTFDVNISAFDITDTLGTGFSIFASVRTTGAAATVCGTPDYISNPENLTIAPAMASIVVSGNNAVVQVTGIAATTIDWNSVTTYVFVS